LGRPQVRYDLNTHDAATFKRGIELLTDLYWAAGARAVLVPAAGVPVLRDGDSAPLRRAVLRARDLELMAFHPLGTARAGADPSRAVLDANLAIPWRFRVVGPETLRRLKEAAGPEAAAKLDRAPTLVVASAAQTGDPVQDEEDVAAATCASYIVLLGAHARGLAGYWRTPAVLRTAEGRAALGIGDDERVLGLLHLGPPRQEQRAPDRAPVEDYVRFLD